MVFFSAPSQDLALKKSVLAVLRKNLLVGGIWLVLLCALAAYWALLLASHQAQRDHVQMQTRQRAAQTAHALSLQVGTLLKTIDYISRNLGELWLNKNTVVVQQAVGVAKTVLPEGALTQVSVANAQGEIVFSSLASQVPLSLAEITRVSIADRAHFQAHLGGVAPHLFISQPLLGRLSQQWMVQFSAPLMTDGKLAGVIVLSVPAEYLSRSLSDIFSNAADVQDVAILLMNDGFYLARSHGLNNVLGKAVPLWWEFLHLPHEQSGAYQATPPIDGIERYYAWHRAADYPVLVNVGLGKVKALAEMDSLVRKSHLHNLLGSVLLLLAAAWITWLWLKQRAQSVALAVSGERFELALRGGDLGSWDYHSDTRMVDCSQRWASMFGYGQTAIVLDFFVLSESIHPDELAQVKSALKTHFRGQTEQYEARYRRRHRSGHWVWVLDRGRVVERHANSAPQRMVGTTMDITVHKLAEAAEQVYHERITKLMAQVPGVVYQYLRRVDKTDCFPYASPGLLTLFGVTPEEALVSAHKVFARIHPADIERITEGARASELQVTGWSDEFRVLQQDGSVRWVLAQARPERVAEGCLHWYGYANDITLDHEAAEKLKLSEEHLRSTLQAVRDGLWGWDVDSGAVQWDLRISEMLGYAEPLGPLNYAQWIERLHPLDRERIQSEWQAQLHGHRDQVASAQYRMRTAKCDWLWVEARGRVVAWGENDLPVRMIGTLSDISSSVAESQLRRAVLDQSTAGIAMVSKDHRLVYANERALEIFAELGIYPDPRSQNAVSLSGAHLRGLGPYVRTLRLHGEVRFEYKLRTGQVPARWFDIHAVLRDPEDMDSDGVWTLIDISQKNASEEALATEHLRLTTLLHRFPGGVLMQDAVGVVAMINQNMCDFFDLTETPGSLQGMHHSQLCLRLGDLRASWLHVPSGALESEKRRTTEVHSLSGRVLEINWVPITRGEQELGRVWLVHDISERCQREEALVTLASTDMLTGLPNRRSFMAALEDALVDVRKHPAQRGILLMADIDHFKRVNDTYGHLVGDVVLQHVAQMMRQGLRQNDSAGRIGGEEFTVLLYRISLADGLTLANRIRQSLADTPAITSAGSIAVTISMGLVVLEGSDATRALSCADEALYAAKNAGRNCVCVWQVSEQGASAGSLLKI
ncbi:PAS domain-containing protein [Simplicispira psychrophila]|uniref:PAS domain-containing protein n=1 Tax=Simplicispira psychrophila TaxID=80882 RepID=UPI0004800B34|nr:PAS domain-containing protein [Simplicispira psychrophila]